MTRTQVAIIGGGPSGLLLARLLAVRGIDSIVVERKTRDYVLGRVRAGVLERGLLDLMDEAGIGDRVRREGLPHDGVDLAYGDETFRINFREMTGHSVMVYGQTEVTRDLYDVLENAGHPIDYEVEDVEIHDADSESPSVVYRVGEATRRIDCDYVAGCDGFHGVSRKAIPEHVRRDYDRAYPYGWLGILSETPPVHHELIYANNARGFALASLRNPELCRYYVQCPVTDRPEDWSDDRFWEEFRLRLPRERAERLVTGPSIEKSIAPLRSFVTEPMRWGRLFLCGDAAHIVPPTGAKGLNTAVSDVYYLYHGLWTYYEKGDPDGLDRYSERALARVWKVERFSWWFSSLMHRTPDQTPFDRKIQLAELDFLRENVDAQRAMATNYVGLPY